MTSLASVALSNVTRRRVSKGKATVKHKVVPTNTSLITERRVHDDHAVMFIASRGRRCWAIRRQGIG